VRWQTKAHIRPIRATEPVQPHAMDPLTGLKGALLHPMGRSPAEIGTTSSARGMAYNFRPNWVFRGGFTVNTLDCGRTACARTSTNTWPPRSSNRLRGIPILHSSCPRARRQSTSMSCQCSAPFIGTNYAAGARLLRPNMRSPYVMNWNTGIQRQLGRNYLLEVNYQGSAGVGLLNAGISTQSP